MNYFKNASVNLFYWILPFCFTIPFLYTVSLYCFPITILSDLLRLLSVLSPRPYWSWYCRCYCLLPTACCLLPDRGSPSGEFYASFKPFPSQGPSKGSISWRIIPRVWCLIATIFPVFNAFCNNLTQKDRTYECLKRLSHVHLEGVKGKARHPESAPWSADTGDTKDLPWENLYVSSIAQPETTQGLFSWARV